MFTKGNKFIVKAYEELNNLKSYERLGIITIILEQWENKLFVDNDNLPMVPQDIGIYNIFAIATNLLFASLQLQNKFTLISTDILEVNIERNQLMKDVLKLYYNLGNYEKLELIVNILISFEHDSLFDNNIYLNELKMNIDFYELATDIYNWNKIKNPIN